MKYARAAAMAAASVAMTAALAGGWGVAQAADDTALVPHPGPDGVVWVPEQTGSGGVVSSGLNSRLDTRITVACQGGGSIEVTFEAHNLPEYTPVTFALGCPTDTPAERTVELGAGLSGSFGVQVSATDPGIRWGLAVAQPE
ncbi:hypothetical protein ACFWBF_21475 [Streptomyces sp. NPDC060028]|uniref:hypothetical protein n=1 Tax=Streptomyces sp. NPDC060028 TaxID=3347041 RepID=UPI00369ED195